MVEVNISLAPGVKIVWCEKHLLAPSSKCGKEELFIILF